MSRSVAPLAAAVSLDGHAPGRDHAPGHAAAHAHAHAHAHDHGDDPAHGHTHHHGHGADGGADRAALPFSLLMAGVWQRLAGVAGLLALLWLAVAWALGEPG